MDDYIELVDDLLVDHNDPLTQLINNEEEEDTMKTVNAELNIKNFMDILDVQGSSQDDDELRVTPKPDWFVLEYSLSPRFGYQIGVEVVKKLVALNRARGKWLNRVKDMQVRLQEMKDSTTAQTISKSSAGFNTFRTKDGVVTKAASIADLKAKLNPDGFEIHDVIEELEGELKEMQRGVSKAETRAAELMKWAVENAESLKIIVRIGNHTVVDDAGMKELKGNYKPASYETLQIAAVLRKQWEDNRV